MLGDNEIVPNYKFLNSLEIKGLGEVLDGNIDECSADRIKEFRSDNHDDFYAALFGEDEMVFCSKLEINGKELWIPEPNPVHIYFYSAFKLVSNLAKSKQNFEIIADQLKGVPNIDTYPYILKFFSSSSQFAFNAFSAVEAFINQSIPEDVNYKSKKKGFVNKEDVERNIYFKEKSTSLMKYIFGRDIVSEKPKLYAKILELKELRDDLIHLKTQNDKYRNQYRIVLNRLLNFNYSESIVSVEEFINFYKSNLIEHHRKVD